MKKYKACVVGHFGFEKTLLNGQTVKTKILSDELDRVFGAKNIKKIDTHGNVFKTMFSVLKAVMAMFTCKNLVILPAHNGVRAFVPLLSKLNILSKCRLHYAVIGGWLADYIKDKKFVKKGLKKFHGIYVETISMKKALNEMGYENIYIMPNCKNLKILDESELVYNTEKPYKLCTFSRVMKEKGIEDAINAVKTINEKYGETVFTLDIYGQVDSNQTKWFENLQKTFPEYVKYGGLVSFDKSTEVLKNYFALLFPTYYDGEGFAGTLIDAMVAGVPVIASDWKYNPEIVVDKKTGILYKTKNTAVFTDKLDYIYNNAEAWNTLKLNCIGDAKKYLPENVIQILIKNLS